MGFLLYHAVRLAPAGKLDQLEFEQFVPKWWQDEEESEDQAKSNLAEKINAMFATLGGGQDPSGH